jgi:hypothetical protein
MNSNLIPCFLISLFAFCSCKDSRKEKLYDKMAAEFCDCYQKSTVDFDKKFSDCTIKVISNNKQSLSELGIGEQNPKEYNRMINEAFLSKERMNQYCPKFIPDLIARFDNLKAKSKIKLRFTGVFSSQEKSGREYLLYLKDEKDSGVFFWSKDSINFNQVKHNILIVYHQLGSNNFVDSIYLK